MTSPEPTISSSDAELDRDVPCLACDYNLRGLPGDPVRCPECFHEEARDEVLARMEDLAWSRRRRFWTPLDRARRDLRDRSNLCAVAVVPGLIGLVGVLLVDIATYDLLMPLTVTSAVVFAVGLGLLTARCRRVPGWRRAMAWHLVWAAVAMMGNVVVTTVVLAVPGLFLVFASEGAAAIVVAPAELLGIPLVVTLYDPLRGITRPARSSFERVARMLAVQDAMAARKSESRGGP